MAIIHEATREVICKIVYHGTNMCGKTTSLLFLNHHLPASQRGRFISLETPTERTLYFDFLPVQLEARGWRLRYLLYTTPGQEYYEASRRLVLKGADGVVFVVDSSRARMADNTLALDLLGKDLASLGQPLDGLPLVLQYNKRDLPDAIPLDEAEEAFNRPRTLLSYPAIASTGQGVYETFVSVSRLALQRLVNADTPATPGAAFGSLVISREDHAALNGTLAHLADQAGAPAAYLVDEGSGLLAAHGKAGPSDFEPLGALLACNFTAAQELVHNLSGRRFSGIVQEGASLHLVAVRVDDRRFVVLFTRVRHDHPEVRRALATARTALGARLALMDAAAPARLAAFAGDFQSIGRPAVARAGAT